MHGSQPHDLASAALHLRRAHPEASALVVLDLAVQGAAPACLGHEPIHPASPFGQVIAAAFDAAMTPAEWSAWAGEGAERTIAEALLRVWSDEVLPRFKSRYGLQAA